MNYTQFFDHLEPKLARLYRDMCMVVEKHFGVESYDCAYIASRLTSAIMLNDYEVFDGPNDIDRLRKMDLALKELSVAFGDNGMSFLAMMELRHALHYGPSYRDKGGELGREAYASEYGESDANALFHIIDAADTYRAAVNRVIAQIKIDPRTKRSRRLINTKAINIVEKCRLWWEILTDKPPPSRDLNPATQFAEFLADTMEAFRIEGDPRSAFRAWAKEQTGST